MIVDLLEPPLNAYLARAVERSESATGLCLDLEGRVMQLDGGAPAFSAYLRAEQGRLLFAAGRAEAADATVSGTPFAFSRLTNTDAETLIREGSLKVSGDDEVATKFRALLDFVRPDPEEELAALTGDTAAHGFGEVVRGMTGWLEHAGLSFGRSVAEYLAEERRELATRAEIEEFCAGVDEVAEGVERLEARIRQLSE